MNEKYGYPARKDIRQAAINNMTFVNVCDNYS